MKFNEKPLPPELDEGLNQRWVGRTLHQEDGETPIRQPQIGPPPLSIEADYSPEQRQAIAALNAEGAQNSAGITPIEPWPEQFASEPKGLIRPGGDPVTLPQAIATQPVLRAAPETPTNRDSLMLDTGELTLGTRKIRFNAEEQAEARKALVRIAKKALKREADNLQRELGGEDLRQSD